MAASRTPLKICHVVTGFGGGVYTSVRQIVEYQCAEGNDVCIIRDFRGPYPGDNADDYPDQVRFHEWEVPREISLRQDCRAFARVWKILRREKPDIIHTHCAKAGFLGRIAALFLRIPTVYSPRGLPFYRADVPGWKRHFFFVLEYILARLGGLIVACSGRELEGVKRLTRRHNYISNGIDLTDLESAFAGKPARDSGKPFTIASVGLINYARNPQLVSRISQRASADWRWIWIGDGELRELLDDHPRIESLGWVDRAEALGILAGADVLLHPSKWEGLPLVVLEAMALELPVVASNVVGNADVVEDQRTGYLVLSDDEYLDRLEKLAGDPDLRERLGAAGRERVIAEFSAQAIVPRWLPLYRDEISRRSG